MTSLKICIHCLAGTCKIGRETQVELADQNSIKLAIIENTVHLTNQITPFNKQDASELFALCSIDKNKKEKRLSMKLDSVNLNQYRNEPVSPRLKGSLITSIGNTSSSSCSSDSIINTSSSSQTPIQNSSSTSVSPITARNNLLKKRSSLCFSDPPVSVNQQ